VLISGLQLFRALDCGINQDMTCITGQLACTAKCCFVYTGTHCFRCGTVAEIVVCEDRNYRSRKRRLGSFSEIGEKLYRAKVYLATPDLFAWTLTIVLLSVICERLLTALTDLAARRLERM